MKIIVVVDSEWGIGKNNGLLFKLPADMANFRRLTTGKTIVVGRNTLNSFPQGKPLANRKNIVLTSSAASLTCSEGVEIVGSIDELKNKLSCYSPDDVFICGGAKLYAAMLEYCSELIITKVASSGGADTFFTNVDEDERFCLAEQSPPIETNGYTITFNTYKNLKTKPLE